MGKLRVLLPVLAALAFGGCALIDIALDATPLPAVERTPTPLINIAALPTLPKLEAEPTEATDNDGSPAPVQNHEAIQYDNDPDIFRDYPGDDFSAEKGSAIRIRGTVEGVGQYSFELLSPGSKLAVVCDDGCFLTDPAKLTVPFSAVKKGGEVIVYGAKDPDDAAKVIADLIVVREKKAAVRWERKEDLYLPNGFYYSEYRLDGVPTLNPLSFTTENEALDVAEKLAERLKLTLAERNDFTYGMYGEIYSVGTEYANPANRAVGRPTRAQISVYSNAYEFFKTWIPYVNAPYDHLWGILNYGGDWFLPTRLTVDINPDPAVDEIVFSDRAIMSQLNYDRAYGYVRTFGYSILNYNLFYFYERAEDGCGFAISRTDYPLGFDEILFAQPRPYAELNPFYSDYLIGFFGKRGGDWYYGEISADAPVYY